MALRIIIFFVYVTANAILSKAQIVPNNNNNQSAIESMLTKTTTTLPQSINGQDVKSTQTLYDFMNENNKQNDNDVQQASVTTTLIEDIAKLLNKTDNYDFNLDDLEDLDSLQNNKFQKRNLYQDVVTEEPLSISSLSEASTTFEGLSLQESPKSNATDNKLTDTRNVYKVIKKKQQSLQPSQHPVEDVKLPETLPSMNISNEYLKDLHSFQLVINLYDQSQWNIEHIRKEVGSKCGKDMDIYLGSLLNETAWALQASDAAGRYRGQFYFNNDFWVGSRSFCEQVNLKRNSNFHPNIAHPEVQFYMVKISFKMVTPMKKNHALQVAQCLPKSCSVNEIEAIMHLDPTAAMLMAVNNSNVISVANVRTIPGEYEILEDNRFYLLTTITIIAAAVVIIATVYEYVKSSSKKPDVAIHTITSGRINPAFINGNGNKSLELHQMSDNNNVSDTETEIKNKINNIKIAKEKQTYLEQILSCFALANNMRTILSGKKVSKDSVSCIHGMRVFSMLWTIMVHTYLQTYAIAENRGQKEIAEKIFWYQILANATYAVDTFFFLSGFLLTLLFIREVKEEKNQKSPPKELSVVADTKKIFLLVLYRYIRLTPALFAVLLFDEVSLKYTYNQSAFPPGLIDHKTCPQYWWRNILYIQTWYPFPELCMIWSWYLANDMQFYIWALILLILSKRYFKTASVLVIGFLLTSWVTSAIISVNLNYTFKLADPLESFGFLYDKVWTRIGPYIMGMIAGYILSRHKDPPKVSKLMNLLLWVMSLAIMALCVFGVWNGVLSVPMTALYISMGHTAWGFALIWITLSCKWGFAKPIDNFLSFGGFLPLSRLTYCTYLIHPVTQIITSFHMQGSLHVHHLMVLTIFLGNAIISYGCAFVISVIFEAPAVNLLRILFKKKKQ